MVFTSSWIILPFTIFFYSVLETEKSLVLAEKGSGDNNDVELIRAAESFRLVATMNPGGDFGKKEVGWKNTRRSLSEFSLECRGGNKVWEI